MIWLFQFCHFLAREKTQKKKHVILQNYLSPILPMKTYVLYVIHLRLLSVIGYNNKYAEV